MPKPYSEDLREKLSEQLDSGISITKQADYLGSIDKQYTTGSTLRRNR
jgi:hypothetical protein